MKIGSKEQITISNPEQTVSGFSAQNGGQSVWGTEIISDDSGIVVEKKSDNLPAQVIAGNLSAAIGDLHSDEKLDEAFANLTPQNIFDVLDMYKMQNKKSLLNDLANKCAVTISPSDKRHIYLEKVNNLILDNLKDKNIDVSVFQKQFDEIYSAKKTPIGSMDTAPLEQFADYETELVKFLSQKNYYNLPSEFINNRNTSAPPSEVNVKHRKNGGEEINNLTLTYDEPDGSTTVTTGLYNDKKKLCEIVMGNKTPSQLKVINKDGTVSEYPLTTRNYLTDSSYEETYDGKTYLVSAENRTFKIKEKDTGEETVIDVNGIVDDNESADKLWVVMKNLPVSVLKDFNVECGKLADIESWEGNRDMGNNRIIDGLYMSNEDEIKTDEKFLTLVHEIGHSLDFRPRWFMNRSTAKYDKEFLKAFNEEMKEYEKSEKKRYDDSPGNENYCTKNEVEMFAECYTFLSTGNNNSRAIIAEYFSGTLAQVKRIMDENRSLPPEKRK